MKNKINIFLIFLALAGISFLSSCDRNRLYEQFVEIPDYSWNNKNLINFKFDIEDTINLHNVYIHVRHASAYPYKNLWLFVKSSSPNGQVQIDTLECNLASDAGKWLGDGSGDIWDLKIPWKMNVRFPYKGRYSVEYEQAMRVDLLPGIMEVGLRVEKVNIK